MAKKKQPQIYEVLIPVRSDKAGRYFETGELVTVDDFPKYIIEGWLDSDPPVLKEVF